jgi:S-DNA-T family DNA segregation ATPase FtsK/SpoIIIE
VSRIAQLDADLARATKAERINILAPIPGKDTVGIELANKNKVLVPLRELLEDETFQNGKAKLPIALGKDVYGKTIIADLASMPHLLVAGATGSGKSVCINSIIASLICRFAPDELRFIMIDPKVVEMQTYADLPHLALPVVTDPKKALLALRWVVREMETRYQIFATEGCRNFDTFNSRNRKRASDTRKGANAAAPGSSTATPVPATLALPETSSSNADTPPWETPAADAGDAPERLAVNLADAASTGDDAESGTDLDSLIDQNGDWAGDSLPPSKPHRSQELIIPDTMPYIVVIIDELADLMQTAPADIEVAIARITQMARAAGIHLIVATQTPRADVITGVIKANVPSRIAFQVASALDSRVILDRKGAEKLVGKGDMLYLPPGTANLVRSQGAFLTDDEIHDLVAHCTGQGKPIFDNGNESLGGASSTSFGDEDEEDEVSAEDERILEKCLEVIRQEKKASTSLLQRRLGLGYTRAARMMDILEDRGIIGPGEGAKPRDILVQMD